MPLARELGVSRVTDITRLDRIGVPVFVSVRPGAVSGSLCVNAGKGVTEHEARAGAVMEAIEFALAEPGTSYVPTHRGTARRVLDGATREDAILDFCPVLGRQIDLDREMSLVDVDELLCGSIEQVPAELVFLPTSSIPQEPCYFGANSNGLASGNSITEATAHGLLEAIERDIRSFEFVHDSSSLLVPDSVTGAAAELVAAITDAGLVMDTRVSTRNPFGLPYAASVLFDPREITPALVNSGYGCHFDPSVATVRAMCEAVQSRLSFIHGGRDDLEERTAQFDGWASADIGRYCSEVIAAMSSRAQITTFDQFAAAFHEPRVQNSGDILGYLLEAIARAGLSRVCRVPLTTADAPLQVVRVLVPGLEDFGPQSMRVGKRLRDYVERR